MILSHLIRFDLILSGLRVSRTYSVPSPVSHDACRLITSYSYDTMAALMLGKELDSFCNPKDDFLDLIKSATKRSNEEFCGVSVPRAFHCISMDWGDAV